MQDTTEKQIKRYRVIARQDGSYYAYQREDTKNREIYWARRVQDAEHFETVSRLKADLKKLNSKKKKVTHYLLSALPKSPALILQVKEELIANHKTWTSFSFETLDDLKREKEEKSV